MPRPIYTVNITLRTLEDVELANQLAEESGMSRTAWATAVIMDALRDGVVYKRVSGTTKTKTTV